MSLSQNVVKVVRMDYMIKRWVAPRLSHAARCRRVLEKYLEQNVRSAMNQKGGYNYARHKGCGNKDEKSGKVPGDFPASCPFKTSCERGQ
jgi:hypothetical protein